MAQAQTKPSPDHQAARKLPPQWAAWFSLTVMILATLVVGLDRNILIVYAASVGKTLALSDTHLGMLEGLGISLLASMIAIPIGWLADRYDTRTVMLLCMGAWISSTLCGATTAHFPVLFICTIGMGLGDAGFGPIVYSLIPKVFPESRRFLANSVYAVTNLLGLGLGLALAGGVGFLGEQFITALPQWSRLADWQASLVVAAAFGAPICVAIFVMANGGKTHTARAARTGLKGELKAYGASHGGTAAAVFCGLGLGSLGISSISIWLPTLLGREYGVQAEAAGNAMALVYFSGIALGVVAGTLGMRLLRPRLGVAMPVRVVACGCTIAASLCLGLWFAQTPMQIYVLFGGIVVCTVSGSVLAPNMMQEMTPSTVRSSVIATGSMVSGAIAALGGPVVGYASDVLPGALHGLRQAIILVALAALCAAAFLFFRVGKSYVRTVKTIGIEDLS